MVQQAFHYLFSFVDLLLHHKIYLLRAWRIKENAQAAVAVSVKALVFIDFGPAVRMVVRFQLTTGSFHRDLILGLRCRLRAARRERLSSSDANISYVEICKNMITALSILTLQLRQLKQADLIEI